MARRPSVQKRLSEAVCRQDPRGATLLRAHSYDGAFYLGGLAVENALKACIARATQRHEFPDKDRVNQVYVHDLVKLLNAAGLASQLRLANPATQAAWARVKDWKVETRYQFGKSPIDGQQFLRAVAGRNGVLQWLRQFW